MSANVSITIDSVEPMKIARKLLSRRYRAPSKKPSLIELNSGIWCYSGPPDDERWRLVPEADLRHDLHLALEDVTLIRTSETGEQKTYRYAALPGSYRTKVEDVMAALRSLIRVHDKQMPYFRGHLDANPMMCVAFQNCIVEVTKEGFKSHPLTDEYVTPAKLCVPWEPGAECPVWMRCLEQWSQGEAEWMELCRRWWGNCILPFRGFAAWMYMYGKVRAGKGLQMRLMSHLMGGAPSFVGLDMEDLISDFGVDGLHETRVIGISEINNLASRDGERAAKLLKKFLGEDETRVRIKHEKSQAGVRVNPAPWVCGNEILAIGNKGDGLASKMIPLHFRTSFLGRTDVELEDKLKDPKELAGIANWALEGALALVQAEPEDRWPLGPSSREVERLFRIYNSPFEGFLQTVFTPKKDGFVASELIRREWVRFAQENEVPHVSPNMLILRMVEESGWAIARAERSLKGRKRPIPGVQGLAWKHARERDL